MRVLCLKVALLPFAGEAWPKKKNLPHRRKTATMSETGPKRHLVRRSDLVASLIGRLGSSAFRLSTTTVSTSLAGSCFSSESAPRPLYGAFLVKKFMQSGASFSFVGFFVR